MRWKGTIPAGQINKTPVTSLDAAATAVTAAGIARPDNFDGADLLPMLAKGTPLPTRTLHWRFWNQAAAREGDWKLLKLGNSKTYLFNLAQDKEEKNNLLEKNPRSPSASKKPHYLGHRSHTRRPPHRHWQPSRKSLLPTILPTLIIGGACKRQANQKHNP